MKRIICWCALLFCAACSPAPKIKYTILATTNSPDGKLQLVVVLQDPGALGGYSTAVFVRKTGDKGLGERVFVTKGQPKVQAAWRSDGNALVACDAKKEDIFSSLPKSGDVQIEYRRLNDTNFLNATANLKKP